MPRDAIRPERAPAPSISRMNARTGTERERTPDSHIRTSLEGRDTVLSCTKYEVCTMGNTGSSQHRDPVEGTRRGGVRAEGRDTPMEPTIRATKGARRLVVKRGLFPTILAGGVGRK